MNTEERLINKMFNQPTQFYKPKSELSELKDRWVSLIRNNASKLVEYAVEKGERDKLPSPELFDIANEIEAFFIGLESKK